MGSAVDIDIQSTDSVDIEGTDSESCLCLLFTIRLLCT